MSAVERFHVEDRNARTWVFACLGVGMKSDDSALFGWFGRLPAPSCRGFPEVGSETGSATSDKLFVLFCFVFYFAGDRN